jgi:hypothetical protein
MKTLMGRYARAALAGAAGLILLAGCGGSSGPGPGLDGVAGTHWRLDRFSAPGSAVPVKVTSDSWLALDSRNTLSLYDSCHWLSGPVKKAGDGFRITETLVTANACINVGAAQTKVVEAVNAVSGGGAVLAEHTADTLQLTAGGYILFYVADGPYPSKGPS